MPDVRVSYERRIASLYQESELDAGIFDCSVAHEKWCPMAGSGRHCCCNPDITIRDLAGKIMDFDRGADV